MPSKENSEELLKNELIRLLETKAFSQISVSELCANVGLNRGTFYLHYSDLEELLFFVQKDLFEESIRQFSENYAGGTVMRVLYRSLFDAICKYRNAFPVIIRSKKFDFLHYPYQLVTATWAEGNHHQLSQQTLDCAFQFAMTGTISYVMEATKSGSYTEEAFETFVALIDNMIFKVIYNMAEV